MSALRAKDWSDISKQVDIMLDKIFQGEDWRDRKDLFTKRKRVYDFLKNRGKHDNHLFNKIQKDKTNRNLTKEMCSVLENTVGVSNGVAQAYKLLLERLGIYSLVVFGSVNYGKENVGSLIKFVENPNDMKFIKKFLKETDKNGINVDDHMFNLVQNTDGSFSFDDPTFAILNKEKGEIFFNYDMIKAYELGQNKIKGMPSIILNMNIGKDENLLLEKIVESKLNKENLVPLPKNIRTFKI